MKIPINLKRFNRLVDRSVNIIVNSNLEMSSNQIAELDEHLTTEGWLLLEEEPQELSKPEPKSTGLTKSRELRREIEMNWELDTYDGSTEQTKEEYYKSEMDKYIQHARSQRLTKNQ